MNNAEIIKELNNAIHTIEAVRDALETVLTDTAPQETPKAKAAIAPKKPVAAESKSEGGEMYTAAELNAMKYNEFKKLASTLGVDCKGTRDEIMSRVIELGVVEDADSPAKEEAPVKETPKATPKAAGKAIANKSGDNEPVGKKGIKKADAPAKDEFDDKAEEIAKETPVKDIISALSDVGVKANNLNFKAQLAKALREGLIELDDEDESTEAEAEAEGGEEEVDGSTYFSDYDLYEVNDPDKMSAERTEACAEKQEGIISAVAEGELSADDITDYLQNNASQEELDLLGEDYDEDDLTKLYCEVAKHFIDEEGAEHEPGEAYMIGEEAYCCGRPLQYDKKTKKFLCSQCAGEYEAE